MGHNPIRLGRGCKFAENKQVPARKAITVGITRELCGVWSSSKEALQHDDERSERGGVKRHTFLYLVYE
jgi:hypothetical protein